MLLNENGEPDEQRVLRSDLGDLEEYGDHRIASYEGPKIPKFLWLTYLSLPIWGIATLIYFWSGSLGWFDRGYWHQLQIAANTVNGNENIYMVLEKQIFEDPKEEPAKK